LNLFLLRGLAREHRHWGEFPAQLKAMIPEAKIIMMDLPGAGELHDVECPTDPDELVKMMHSHFFQKIHKTLKSQKNSEENFFIGLSLGGIVGLKWNELYPQDFKKIFLINSSLASLGPFWHRLRPMAICSLLRIFFTRNTIKREQLIYQLTSSLPINPDEIHRWANYFLEHPFKRKNFIHQIIIAIKIKIQQPPGNQAIFICGLNDQLVSPKSSQLLAQWGCGSPLITHPSAGHDLSLDDGEWLAMQIKKSL
jgi:pimeloyl-ACP methyl ester carboxylesterase